MTGSAIVTGGAGFIGSHLVDALLAQGKQVTVIDDLSSGDQDRLASEATLLEIDIVDRAAVLEAFSEVQPDAVFHLAAQSSVTVSVKDPLRDLQVNVAGTLNVLDGALAANAPLVFSSTGGALYGDQAPLPTPETWIPSPLAPYGASKWAGEAYVNTWSLSSGVPNAICRLGNVYGPRQSPHGEAGVVAIFCGCIHEQRRPKLFGDGKPTRDYVYVQDVVEALIAGSGRRGTFNVATSVETDVATLWSELKALSSSDLEPELADLRPGELQRSRLDVSRIESELGWRAKVDVKQGLLQTYEALMAEFGAAPA
jgi:UDP-glucose 4-epimerase